MADQRSVLDVVKVGVAAGEGVPHDKEGGEAGDERDLLEAAAQHAGLAQRGQLVEEALSRAVLLPLRVHVDGATVAALRRQTAKTMTEKCRL